MNTKISLALFALAMGAVPVSAQVSTTDRVRDRVILGGERTGTQRGGTIGDVIYGRSDDARTTDRIPPGHLPPRGMCRVWIDGVPPGRQPAPTSCANAQRDRLQYGPNARVIYGDDTSHPGRGNGRYKNRDQRGTDAIYRSSGARAGTTVKQDKAQAKAQSKATGKAQAAKGKGKGKN